LDVIATVGPSGHFLTQEHTRQHLRRLWIPPLSHPCPPIAGVGLRARPLPDIRQRARAELDRILAEHQPEPLEPAVQAELQAILDAAAQELSTWL
jgi:trimethylamine--corrinoid protein Co-methyltransferase